MPALPATPRVLIVAFQGWSDAGDATSDTIEHLRDRLPLSLLHVIGAEGYVDYQVHRPRLLRDGSGSRIIDWPDTKLYGPSPETAEPAIVDEAITGIDGSRVSNLYVLSGVEPAREWQSYVDEITDLVDIWQIDIAILLGAMYSDAPHSRPIATTVSSESSRVRSITDAEQSSYEGPIGISTVLDLALTEMGVETVSLWAHVPHYVHSAPSPKASLALLDKLEELLDLVIPRGQLLQQATEWEATINRIAHDDEEMTRYIRRLEESRDQLAAAGSSGEALAMEFERFLEEDSDGAGDSGPAERPSPENRDTDRDKGENS